MAKDDKKLFKKMPKPKRRGKPYPLNGIKKLGPKSVYRK